MILRLYQNVPLIVWSEFIVTVMVELIPYDVPLMDSGPKFVALLKVSNASPYVTLLYIMWVLNLVIVTLVPGSKLLMTTLACPVPVMICLVSDPSTVSHTQEYVPPDGFALIVN